MKCISQHGWQGGEQDQYYPKAGKTGLYGNILMVKQDNSHIQSKECDRNKFKGTLEELKDFWIS